MMAVPLMSAGSEIIRYYQIVAGQKRMGCYTSEQEAAKELRRVRQEWADSQDGTALTSITCSIEPAERITVKETESFRI